MSMQTLKIDRQRTIILPRKIFKPNDRVLLFTEGDTAIVKKLTPSRLSDLATHTKERPLPLAEVVREIQAYRRERRGSARGT